MTEPGSIERTLIDRRESGHKLLVPYVTGGYGDDWLQVVHAVAAAGADAIEIGIPFSDPVMDGPVIQRASESAIRSGATPASILDELRQADVGVPLAVMTYYNIAFRMGLERFAHSLADSGVSGAILPDLPLDEAEPWLSAAANAEVEPIMLAAPTAPDDRLKRIADRSRGFVYGVGLVGITGVRQELSDRASEIARRLKKVTDKPVLVGVGIGTPDQAAEVCEVADGVVIGSAVVRQMLTGEGPEAVGNLVAEFRAVL